MNLHDAGRILIPVLFVAIAIGSIWWTHARGLSLLENWAQGQGYEILTRLAPRLHRTYLERAR